MTYSFLHESECSTQCLVRFLERGRNGQEVISSFKQDVAIDCYLVNKIFYISRHCSLCTWPWILGWGGMGQESAMLGNANTIQTLISELSERNSRVRYVATGSTKYTLEKKWGFNWTCQVASVGRHKN